jgi:2-methylisocitrate lyase-like PEP mutase family enzyme
VFPKRSSLHSEAQHELLHVEEFARKIESAVSVRHNKDFVVIARTEALIAGLGQEEALRRAHVYEEAGADCILLHSKSKSASEVVQCLHAWTGKARFVLVPTNYPDLTEPAIDQLGKVAMVIYGNHVVRASVKAVRGVLAEMRAAGGAHTVGDRLTSLQEMFSIQGDFGNSKAAKET